MIILGIETSCDETAAAVVQKDKDGVKILSNVVASSAKLQEEYGGVIPEQAAREQLRSIIPVIHEALTIAFQSTSDSKISNFKFLISKIDAIAVTYGPGLIGSLLVGVETAKTLATIWQKPLIPINHLIGHFYANWIENQGNVSSIKYYGRETKNPLIHNTNPIPQFPAIGLLVSGGHTDLLLFKGHGKYETLGGTRDDAAGECFDKCARLLGLPYPGGPAIAKLAASGNPSAFDLPRPMIDSKDFDFSFSGLKTAVANLLTSQESKPTWEVLADLGASIEQAIVDVLVKKSIQAVEKYGVKSLIVAGGVAANQKLKDDLRFKTACCRKVLRTCEQVLKINDLRLKTELFIPPAELCTDNAAMIAAAAFFNYQPIDPLKLQADPNLALFF